MDMLQLDLKVPRNHWTALSREDQTTFMQLHLHFIRQQKEHMKDRRNNTFFNDIQCLLQFIEYSPIRKDDRAICVGLACSGPYVCVNTQQIKIILGRCKSSINNSFQMIGYEAVKTKGKSREAILAIIPALSNEQNTLRKWTVRCASESSTCCFVSRFQMTNLPIINDEDLYDEKKSVRSAMASFQRQRQGSGKNRHLMFNLQNQQSPPSPPSPSNAYSPIQSQPPSQPPQPQQPFMGQRIDNFQQPFMSLNQPQPNFYQNQGQFQQQPINMFQQPPMNFYQTTPQNQQQSGQLFLPPMNFGAPSQPAQNGMINQSNMPFQNMQQQNAQQPIVMQPMMMNQSQSTPSQPLSQQPQVQQDDNGFLTMMRKDNMELGISFLSDNDDDDTSMSSFANGFDITPSFSLDYLAEYNNYDDDNSNFGNLSFNKNTSSPLDPSSIFSFPRSQSASFAPNYD